MQRPDEDFVRTLSHWAFEEFSHHPGENTLWMAQHYRTLIATWDGQPSGFVVVDLVRQPEAALTAIAVLPRARGRGVGGALVGAAELAARSRGRSALMTHTADANLAALDLFLKRGFRIVRRVSRYYLGMYNACELVKRW